MPAPPLTPLRAAMMPGATNIFGFAAFNALSFQMVLGSPMILYAKTLGAGPTTLGVIASLMPILVIFQIPAARYVDAVGYKKFVLSGWAARTLFIGVLALVPMLGRWVPASSQLTLVLLALFLFNLIRGISSCGWLPWISSIIPANIRGRYLTVESSVTNGFSLVAFLLAAWILGSGDPAPWRFSALFVFSALAAGVSLFFINRIPDPNVHDPAKASAPPGYRTILGLQPFRKILVMNVVLSLSTGAVVTFVVDYLKEMANWAEQHILILISVTFMGGMLNQVILYRVLDRFGSRPVLLTGTFIWALILAGWSCVAGGLVPLSLGFAVLLTFGVGLANSMVNLANVRLVMLSIPDQGRSHYFAIFSVVAAVSLGLAPVLWGFGVEVFDELSALAGTVNFEWNCYSLLFAWLSLLFCVTLVLCTRLEEPEAVKLEELLSRVLKGSRVKYWLRFWFRTTPRG